MLLSNFPQIKGWGPALICVLLGGLIAGALRNTYFITNLNLTCLILMSTVATYLLPKQAYGFQPQWLASGKQEHTTIFWLNPNSYKVQAEGFANSSPEVLRLPFRNNNIHLVFMSNLNSNADSYKFRLENFDETWSLASNSSTAHYSNLPPGKYELQVLSLQGNNWSSTPTSIGVEVIAPFWRAWWFYLSMGVLVIVLLIAYNNYRVKTRVKRFLAKEKARDEQLKIAQRRMARDFHDELGNKLASIGVSADLVGIKLRNKDVEIDRLLDRIQLNTKSLFAGTKDFIWSIDPSSDNIIETLTYLKDYGEDYFAHTAISFFADAPNIDSRYHQLPAGKGAQILTIFKEVMRQMQEKEACQSVHLQMSLDQDEFTILLKCEGDLAKSNCTEEEANTGLLRGKAKSIDCALAIERWPTQLTYKLTGRMPQSRGLSNTRTNQKLKT